MGTPESVTEKKSFSMSRHGTDANTDERIYILGVGNLGRLFAHSLATKINPPPITLLLHRFNLLQEWGEAGRSVEIETNGIPSAASNIDVEVIDPTASTAEPISNLIVTTKTLHTVSAINSIKKRLGGTSTIAFAQNGMGTMDAVTSTIFPGAQSRPQYLAAITSHGVYSTGPFSSVHAGLAHISVGPVWNNAPHSHPPQQLSLQSEYLVEQIVRATVLNATAVTAKELTHLQLQKLVINAMMNPLTVIFDCKNGELFTRDPILRVMRALLAEASNVLLSLPELCDPPSCRDEINSKFSTDRLEEVVLDVARKTAGNTSSMLQDFRAGRETEIDYINGYIVRGGKDLGVDVRNNERLVAMVKEGRIISVDEVDKYFPR